LIVPLAFGLGTFLPVLPAQQTPHPLQSSSDTGRPKQAGPIYVELDSWIYPAIERLASLGYIHSQFLGMRPWSRIDCAQMVQEARDELEGKDANTTTEAEGLYASLQEEFQGETDSLEGRKAEPSIQLESVYANVTGISGQPLNDSYHFGQTLINNFGRPFQQGSNSWDGFSGYAVAGPFAIYARGEFQRSPSAPAYPLAVRQAIATVDNNPIQPAIPTSEANQFRLLDTYVAANLEGWNLSFGKQSLWWGPGAGGALLFSDNAEPIYMWRASRTAPFVLPWVLHYLGPMKLDFFFGKLSGNESPPRPLIHGEKVSFKPTPNLELGFSRTSELSGVGRPLTFLSLWRSYTLFTSAAFEAANANAGKRTGGFDLSYRVPFVRNWLTVYTDSLSDDDPSPIANPPRAAFNPGVYLTRIPGIPKLDFRVEAVYTDTPTSSPSGQGGHFVYYDGFYHDLYTNKNNLIGSWIGREGTGFQGWSTYWLSPRNTVQFGYRHATVSKGFIPDGETLNDGSVKLNWWFRDDLSLSGFLQYEKWRAPILNPSPQTDWTSSVQITFWPVKHY